MKLKITIELENDAFQGAAIRETKRVLEVLVRRLAIEGFPEKDETYALYDHNGNKVGTATCK